MRSDTHLLSMHAPNSVKYSLENEDWSKVMKKEIGTKWVYMKKLDENGEVTRNKERLFCKGYAQQEGIDYEETFSPVAKVEGVITFLAYFAYKFLKVYQMDVKSIFLNGLLEREVYIEKP